MRILHVLGGTGWGGAERLACTLHRLALQHGHESRLELVPLPEIVRGATEHLGAPLPRARPGEQALWRWVLAARARRRAFAPDVVHVHLATPKLGVAAATICGRAPTLTTFHLLPRGRWPRDALTRLDSGSVLRFLLRRGRRRLTAAVSRTDAARLRERLGSSRVRVVLNAVPLPAPAPTGEPLLWPDGAVRLLSVGRLHEQKGFDRLIGALSSPRVRHLPWYWVVLGEGPERARLADRVHAAGLDGRVNLAGQRAAESEIRRADLILCPSRFEGMPLVPLEALAAAKPVLLSDIAPHRELLEDVPETFLPADDGRWPERLRDLLESADSRAALRALQASVSGRRSSSRMFLDYLALYRELAES